MRKHATYVIFDNMSGQSFIGVVNPGNPLATKIYGHNEERTEKDRRTCSWDPETDEVTACADGDEDALIIVH